MTSACGGPPSPYTLVSVNAAGTGTGNGASGDGGLTFRGAHVSISADGTKVAFASEASDLGPTDTTHCITWDDQGNQITAPCVDVYVRDRTAGTTTLVSSNAGGTDSANDRSSDPVISPDGTKVAFWSAATDLGPADANNALDIYVRDLATGATTLLSSTGAPGSGGAGTMWPAVTFSADSSRVLFQTRANLSPLDSPGGDDLYLYDFATGSTTLVSVNAAGTAAAGGERGSFSPDGAKVVFDSKATSLGPPITTTGHLNVFVHDLATGVNTLVSGHAGVSSDSQSYDAMFSPDGSKVLFRGSATNLGPPKTTTHADLFISDLATGTIQMVSVNAAGTDGGGGYTGHGQVSPDGTSVVFVSAASDLVANDSNLEDDVFIRDLTTGVTRAVSVNAAGTSTGNFHSRWGAFSLDGTKVVFRSLANDLLPGDPIDRSGIYVRDLASNTTSLFDGHGGVGFPVLATGASVLAVVSYANDLVPGDTNNTYDVFVATLS